MIKHQGIHNEHLRFDEENKNILKDTEENLKRCKNLTYSVLRCDKNILRILIILNS